MPFEHEAGGKAKCAGIQSEARARGSAAVAFPRATNVKP
jgi:hypothetical protein